MASSLLIPAAANAGINLIPSELQQRWRCVKIVDIPGFHVRVTAYYNACQTRAFD